MEPGHLKQQVSGTKGSSEKMTGGPQHVAGMTCAMQEANGRHVAAPPPINHPRVHADWWCSSKNGPAAEGGWVRGCVRVCVWVWVCVGGGVCGLVRVCVSACV